MYVVARMDHLSCPLLLLVRKQKTFYRFEVANINSVTQFAQWSYKCLRPLTLYKLGKNIQFICWVHVRCAKLPTSVTWLVTQMFHITVSDRRTAYYKNNILKLIIILIICVHTCACVHACVRVYVCTEVDHFKWFNTSCSLNPYFPV